MDPANVTIIIPALNEEDAIGDVIHSIKLKIPSSEIIVVNDGSSDNTQDVATKSGALVINHEVSRGYGAALRTGVEAAKNDYVLFCDGDGQHSSEDVCAIISACDGCDMIIGARNTDSHIPLVRRPGKFIMKAFANYLAGEKIPDLNSGLRIVKKDILLKYIHLMPLGFSFSTTTTFAFLKTNRKIKYISITVKRRKGVSSVRQWKHGPQALMLMLRLTVLFEPLKVFLSVSGVLFIFTCCSFILDFVLSDGKGIGDTTVMLSLSTLLVFMFGLLCDQVSALRRQLHE